MFRFAHVDEMGYEIPPILSGAPLLHFQHYDSLYRYMDLEILNSCGGGMNVWLQGEAAEVVKNGGKYAWKGDFSFNFPCLEGSHQLRLADFPNSYLALLSESEPYGGVGWVDVKARDRCSQDLERLTMVNRKLWAFHVKYFANRTKTITAELEPFLIPPLVGIVKEY